MGWSSKGASELTHFFSSLLGKITNFKTLGSCLIQLCHSGKELVALKQALKFGRAPGEVEFSEC